MSTDTVKPTRRRNATGSDLSLRVGPRVPDVVWDDADADAAEQGLQLSAWVRMSLEAYLDSDRVVLVPGVRASSVRVISMVPALWERAKARASDDGVTLGEVVTGALAWAHELRVREANRSRKPGD